MLFIQVLRMSVPSFAEALALGLISVLAPRRRGLSDPDLPGAPDRGPDRHSPRTRPVTRSAARICGPLTSGGSTSPT